MTGRSWMLAALIVSFVALATLYNAVVPVFESPDELQHVAFVAWLDDHGSLPVVTEQDPGPWEQEGTQAPLYYWLASVVAGWQAHDESGNLAKINPHAGGIGDPLRPDNKNRVIHDPAVEGWPYRGTVAFVHWLRLFSTLMGAGTVVAVYRLGWIVFPGRPGMGPVMAALVAFTPQFLFVSASANNDNLIILIASWVLVVLAGWLSAPGLPRYRSLAALGLLLGVAALSKLSGVLLWVLVAAAMLWLAWRARNWRWLAAGGPLVLGLALAVSGWWFARNLRLYGDLTGISAHLLLMGSRETWPRTLAAILAEFRGFRYSFWALFGWFNILAPDAYYWILDILGVAGLAGLGLYLVRAIRRRQPWPAAVVLLLAAWLGLVMLGLVRWTLLTPASQGRLLFPALGALALFLVAGLAEWLPRRLHRPAALAALVPWVAWAALCPIAIIAPVYRPPQRVQSLAELEVVPVMLNVRFGACCELVGYIEPDYPVRAGSTVPLTLVWRSRQATRHDWSVYVHANTPGGDVLGQVDTYPGGGRYPTSHWQPGEILSDTVYIPISSEAEGPAQVLFNVGLYDVNTRQELSAVTSDGDPAKFVFAGEVALEPPTWPTPQPEIRSDALFGQEVRLIGADFSAHTAAPGDVITVTLHWQALTHVRDDYVGFIHMLLPGTDDVIQDDHPPRQYPTRLWYRGTVLADPYRLVVPETAAAGQYALWGGLYRPRSYDRLRAVSWQTGERWKDDLVYIGTVTVGPALRSARKGD